MSNSIIRGADAEVLAAREPCEGSRLTRPEPRLAIYVRPATQDDFAFIDALQKKQSKAVGFLHKQTVESYIARGDVLIAVGESEGGSCHSRAGGNRANEGAACDETLDARLRGHDGSGRAANSRQPIADRRLGYIIGCDKYFKREDVGIIYQVNVAAGGQRSLVGAMLVQEMFERAAFGCKLFCCWCAQDLEANHFWEALGFVPIAFRTGSARKKGAERMHIFWQKRIRAGDEGPGATPWWFPSQTTGGALRADRLVLPMPPGMHWSDAKPAILPEVLPDIPGVDRLIACETGGGAADDDNVDGGQPTKQRTRRTKKGKAAVQKNAGSIVATGGFRFGAAVTAEGDDADAGGGGGGDGLSADAEAQKRARPRPQRKVYHPKYVQAARDLCARYLDEVQQCPALLEGATDGGKYDVSRALEHVPSAMQTQLAQEEHALAERAPEHAPVHLLEDAA